MLKIYRLEFISAIANLCIACPAFHPVGESQNIKFKLELFFLEIIVCDYSFVWSSYALCILGLTCQFLCNNR